MRGKGYAGESIAVARDSRVGCRCNGRRGIGSMHAESSKIVQLSTRGVAPADRLSYASSVLSSALAPSALSTEAPLKYELEVTALELPTIAIVHRAVHRNARCALARRFVGLPSPISFWFWSSAIHGASGMSRAPR